MPSPIGHALGALAAGWGAAGRLTTRRELMIQSAMLALVGMAPDLDLLWGRHSRETHSLGAALIVAAIGAWWRWPVGPRSRWGIFLVVALAWFTHPLLDTLGHDDSVPLGVLLWWPFSQEFVMAPRPLFNAVARFIFRDDFVSQNVVTLAKELLILGPIVTAVWFWRRRASART